MVLLLWVVKKMKYLEILSSKRVFDYNYVLSITKTRTLADKTIQNYLKKGYIKRVKKNLYATMSLETKGVIPNKFEIASNITKTSYISHQSAFEFYGFSNQVSNEIRVSSLTKFKDFDFENNMYHYIYTKSDKYVDIIKGVKVSSVCKTIVDTIDSIKSYDDLEELIHNLSVLNLIRGNSILDYLKYVNKKILYNKVGLILFYYVDGVLLTEGHLNQMKNNGLKIIKDFNKEKHRLNKYYKEWRLHCYDLDKLIMEDRNV
jgi:predicted transcriptional regulator of viral defense system